MRVDFIVECLAEGNRVFGSLVGGHRLVVVTEPEMDFVKEVETRGVGEVVSIGLVFGTKEDRRCKDALECLDNPPVVTAVLGQVKEVEHLSGAVETNGTALLLYGERRYPNRNEAVLAEGKTKLGMARDLEEELPVVPGMDELALWGRRRGIPHNTKGRAW